MLLVPLELLCLLRVYDLYITHESSLFSVTLDENSRVEKKTNIIEKEVFIKSRTDAKSQKLREDVAQVTKF